MKFLNRKNIVKNLVIITLLYSTTAVYSANFPQAGDFSNGAKTWAENCSRCHNLRGPEELRDDQWITTTFHMRVRGGLTGQEARDVITFLQTSNNKPVPPVSLTQMSSMKGSGTTGEAIYNQTCISCHGADGSGAFPGVPDFSTNSGPLSKSDNVLIGHITEGFQSPGSLMAMPAKGGNPALTLSDIGSVVKYIRKMFSQ